MGEGSCYAEDTLYSMNAKKTVTMKSRKEAMVQGIIIEVRVACVVAFTEIYGQIVHMVGLVLLRLFLEVEFGLAG